MAHEFHPEPFNCWPINEQVHESPFWDKTLDQNLMLLSIDELEQAFSVGRGSNYYAALWEARHSALRTAMREIESYVNQQCPATCTHKTIVSVEVEIYDEDFILEEGTYIWFCRHWWRATVSCDALEEQFGSDTKDIIYVPQTDPPQYETYGADKVRRCGRNIAKGSAIGFGLGRGFDEGREQALRSARANAVATAQQALDEFVGMPCPPPEARCRRKRIDQADVEEGDVNLSILGHTPYQWLAIATATWAGDVWCLPEDSREEKVGDASSGTDSLASGTFQAGELSDAPGPAAWNRLAKVGRGPVRSRADASGLPSPLRPERPAASREATRAALETAFWQPRPRSAFRTLLESHPELAKSQQVRMVYRRPGIQP